MTGAGSGIGLETVHAFLGEGVRVVAVDINAEPLKTLPSDRVISLSLDIRNSGAAEEAVEAAVTTFGRVDILFNNAALLKYRDSFLSVADSDWQETFSVNILGYIRAARAALPPMLAAGRGVMIHVASQAARMPPPSSPDYSVSKAAVLMLSKVIAQEFTGRGVRSNVISPAHIRTPIWDRPGGVLDNLLKRYGVDDRNEAIQIFLKENKMPAARLGRPREVADLALFLSSDISEFITGADLPVDGGVRPFV